MYADFVYVGLRRAEAGGLENRRRSLLYAAIAATLYASVIASASRAGTLLVTLEILAIVLLAPRRSRLSLRNRALTLGLITGFALLFTAVVGWDTLWRRFFQPDPYAVRREFLQASLALIRDRPWVGFG